MDKLRLYKILMVVLVVFAAGTLPVNAYAQVAASSSNPCQIQNTYPPKNSSKPNSEFGDVRSNTHTGTDFFYNGDQLLPVPAGCVLQKNPNGNLVWEQNSKIKSGARKGQPNGWGWYVVFDCGKQGADTIKQRIAHVPKQPFGPGSIRMGCSGNAGGSRNMAGEVSEGCSRSGEHYHTETFVGKQAVDTECVLGMTKTNQNATNANASCLKCANPGPVNLCDPSALAALKSKGRNCIGKSGIAPAESTGSGVDPNSIKGSGPTPGTTPGANDTGSMDDGDGGHSHEHDEGTPGGGTGFTPPDIFGDPDEPDPPEEPPLPDTPGIPGGTANLVPPPASGQEPKELKGCATDTWTAMVNQAVMQTRREDILNKRFIVKPDSVIDYSCFMFFVDKVADEAGPVFSESKKWANLKVDLIGKQVDVKRELGNKSLDGALMDIVESVATNYSRGQFNNPLLAGTAPVDTATGAKNCSMMAKVWKAAKCKNFDGVEVFYTFEDLMSAEPREYPANMKCN